MSAEDARVGPVQLVLVGFETTERFRGDAVRELAALRGHGMIRVLRLNGHAGNGTRTREDVLADTVGFALDDLRHLADEIRPGEHVAAVLIEHLWADGVREAVLDAGGRLVGQGFLTPEVMLLVGSELQARAEAQAALELAEAARGSAILDALWVLAGHRQLPAEDTAAAATQVVRVLVEDGLIHGSDSRAAIDSLVDAGMIESASLDAATAQVEETFEHRPDDDDR